MSAIPQFRPGESSAGPTDPKQPVAVPAPTGGNTVQLLQDAIAKLKSSNGDLPDHAQVASLLAEAREALEHANVIARAAEQSQAFLKEGDFDKALEALDTGLLVYPEDPALITRRRKVEEQQKTFHSAAAVRTALDQAEWLLELDRTDLAARLLEEKIADLPDQPALKARLDELEALMPAWEQSRRIQAALKRVEAVAQLEQWQAAQTILEEALQAYPTSPELIAEAKRVREQLGDHEHRKKLARRLELIGKKIASQAWRQALTLLESTQQEFPDAPELSPLWCDVNAGLRLSEREAVVSEIRQCLADGELELAEEILHRGRELFGQDPALQTLHEQLTTEREYREQLRDAQILFGRRQFQEAESIVSELVDESHPEAQALLDAVRTARAAAEEESFCERGREKAVELMQQRQFAQAADLLRNLVSLFPRNIILERDLMAAERALDQASPEIAEAAEAEDVEPSRPVIARLVIPPPVIAPPLQRRPQAEAKRGLEPREPAQASAPSRFRRAAIAGGLSLALVSAAGLAWKSSSGSAPVSGQAAKSVAPAEVVAPAAAPWSLRRRPRPRRHPRPGHRHPQLSRLPARAARRNRSLVHQRGCHYDPS